MDLPDLIREAIAGGRLCEPFSAREVARALSCPDWPVSRVHSYLVRYCMGNLAASQVLFERVRYGRYRLLYDGPRDLTPPPTKFRRRPTRIDKREDPTLPGESES
ncbi:MAG: hypothetical protein AUH92_05215 [Acidobacteria bacterium 13_1_40CM_4_69_4]|nr:MAG: hypothetical protein AUH92_05215 [Acidobacteria bacterium 13_1_40CM_4_69_4]